MVQMGETVRDDRRGFTLIEMMIVVAVIAILAAVVIPTFFRESGKTKSISEVTPTFTEIANKLEQYKSETGRYINTTTLENDTPVVCPSAPSKAGINPFSETCGAVWTELRVNPPQTLMRCSYKIQVGDVGDTLAEALPAGLTFTPPATTGWWALLATCDADNQGVSSTNGQFLMTSVDATIQKVNDAL
jgi:prepilin-type N-terminal cleavage/methylation domain-containing protein